MYRVILHKSAAKKFAKLSKNLKEKIAKSIELVSLNPYAGKKLHGQFEGSYRVRVGDFRIIYDVYDDTKIVVVHAIGSRGDVYK